MRPIKCLIKMSAEGWHEVGVKVQSRSYRAVTKARLNLLGVSSLLDQQACANMSQIVEPYVGVDVSSSERRLKVMSSKVRTS
jgi:hypothetical protein